MTIAFVVAAFAACLLAFANGANDNSKGVATLIGAGTMSARGALLYAAVTTFLGSMTALVLAGALLETFGGKGIVPEAVLTTGAFPISVGLGAAATVLLATRLGIPVSTTHALVGALTGVGLASDLIWSGVWTKFAYPLLAAPLLAFAPTVPVYLTLRALRRRSGITAQSCVCLEKKTAATLTTEGAMSADSTTLHVRPGHLPGCREQLEGRVVGLDAQRTLDVSHILGAGAVSFARGLNDTPKIAAIILAASAVAAVGDVAFEPRLAILAVGVGIAVGGLLAARRVATTMGRKITDMNDGQAFTANFITAILVIFASRLGVPVSTTHVSCGSLFGIGAVNGTAKWRMIGRILIAWVTTVPLGALLGYLIFVVAR